MLFINLIVNVYRLVQVLDTKVVFIPKCQTWWRQIYTTFIKEFQYVNVWIWLLKTIKVIKLMKLLFSWHPYQWSQIVCDPFGKRVRVARGKLYHFLPGLISLEQPRTKVTGCFNSRTNYGSKRRLAQTGVFFRSYQHCF